MGDFKNQTFQKCLWIHIRRRIFSSLFCPEQPTGGRLQKTFFSVKRQKFDLKILKINTKIIIN